eukprot:774208_1
MLSFHSLIINHHFIAIFLVITWSFNCHEFVCHNTFRSEFKIIIFNSSHVIRIHSLIDIIGLNAAVYAACPFVGDYLVCCTDFIHHIDIDIRTMFLSRNTKHQAGSKSATSSRINSNAWSG